MNEDLTYTSAQISTARRQQLEQLRLKMTVERDEIVILRDALDAALNVGLAALLHAANTAMPVPPEKAAEYILQDVEPDLALREITVNPPSSVAHQPVLPPLGSSSSQTRW